MVRWHTKDSVRVYDGGRPVRITKAAASNSVFCDSAPWIDGAFEYRLRLNFRTGPLFVGWAPATLDVEAANQQRECGYWLSLSYPAQLCSQPGTHTTCLARLHSQSMGVLRCRYDTRRGTISYLFDEESRGAAWRTLPFERGELAFTDVPCEPRLFPAVTGAQRAGTEFAFLM